MTGSPLVLLVDDDPVRSWIALRALRPAHVMLVHSAGYLDQARRLADAAREVTDGVALIQVEDDTSTEQVRAAYEALPREAHLHYAGGTGSIAALLRAFVAQDGRPPAQASTFDTDRRLLRLDDGTDVPLRGLLAPGEIALGTVLRLHGWEFDEGGPCAAVRAEGARVVERLIDAFGWSVLRDVTALDDVRQHLEILRPDRSPLADAWTFFIAGAFFEHLVAATVRALAPELDVRCGARLRRGETRVEVDVLFVADHRLHVLSCTASASATNARVKLFEVQARARQLGGPAARPGVLTGLPASHPEVPRALAEAGRIDDGPAGRPVVLGLADLYLLASAAFADGDREQARTGLGLGLSEDRTASGRSLAASALPSSASARPAARARRTPTRRPAVMPPPPSSGATDTQWRRWTRAVVVLAFDGCGVEHGPARELTLSHIGQVLARELPGPKRWGRRLQPWIVQCLQHTDLEVAQIGHGTVVVRRRDGGEV